MKELKTMRRINIKKVFQTIAVGLIAMPEPFTTPVGIILLGVVFAVYRERSLDKFGDLEALTKISLRSSKPVGFRRYLGANQVLIHHRAKQPTLSAGIYWFDNRTVSKKILHHTLKTSFPQYEAVKNLNDKRTFKPVSSKDFKTPVQFHKLKPCL